MISIVLDLVLVTRFRGLIGRQARGARERARRPQKPGRPPLGWPRRVEGAGYARPSPSAGDQPWQVPRALSLAPVHGSG